MVYRKGRSPGSASLILALSIEGTLRTCNSHGGMLQLWIFLETCWAHVCAQAQSPTTCSLGRLGSAIFTLLQHIQIGQSPTVQQALGSFKCGIQVGPGPEIDCIIEKSVSAPHVWLFLTQVAIRCCRNWTLNIPEFAFIYFLGTSNACMCCPFVLTIYILMCASFCFLVSTFC